MDCSDKGMGAYRLFFGSLASPRRLGIINLLRQGKKNVSEIASELGYEQTMVSHNLRRLERCGMVFVEQKGKNRYYSVNRKTIKPLMALIDKHIHAFCRHIIFGGSE